MLVVLKELLVRLEGQNEKGQTLIEYALIAVLISIAIIVVIGLVGTQLDTVFSSIIDALTFDS